MYKKSKQGNCKHTFATAFRTDKDWEKYCTKCNFVKEIGII